LTALPTFTALGAGPTVLMLHGVDGGHLAFAPQVETLASSGFRAVAWNMPGYGRSAPIEPYTFKGLAASCIALIEGLRCGEATLVGHGMGGMVAQEVVARRPELVSKLVLCGTAPSFRETEADWQRDYIDSRMAPLDAGQGMAQLAQMLVPQWIGPGALPEGVQLAQHCMAQVNPSTYRRALQALPTFDRRADLPRIHVPTLLLAGEHDRSTPPAVMQAMARQIRGSTYLEMRGIGHLQNLEAPDEFDAAVLNFLHLPRQLH
jgi:3-oxoadipate enol-lactonase